MKILILNWKDIKNPAAGGAEHVAFLLAKKLIADGNSVTFFCRKFNNSQEYETLEGVPVIRRGNVLSVYIEAYLYYRSLVVKPDLVIDMVNTVCWQTPLYVSKEKRLLYVNQLAKEVWFYEKSFPLSWIGYLLEKFEYIPYKDTRAICYSQGTKADLISFGIPANHISLFPLGIDHSIYKQGGGKEKYPLFLFVGRLVKMKRASLCVEAFAKVIKKEPTAKLVIIGNGPEEKPIRALINKNNLKNHIQIITGASDIVKRVQMQKSWAILVPSVKEGWGMIVTEAAACGTPAVVTNVTGLSQAVQKDTTGLIISAHPSAQELADAMILIAQKSIRSSLTKNSITWAKQFTWEKSYQEFKEIVYKNYEKK